MKLIASSYLFLLRSSFAFRTGNKATLLSPFIAQKSFHSVTALKMASKPFSVIVEAEIKEDRIEDFLKMIENNAAKSREESGCIRFDVLQDQSKENKFWFYEVYESTDAVAHHKTTSHYQSWADFKEGGGTISSVSHKADGVFIGNKA